MFPIKVKCFFYKSDYGSRRASKYSIITHLGVRVNAKEIGMTDKKEAVLLKINQINVELDSLMAWGEFVLVLMSFADKFQPSR